MAFIRLNNEEIRNELEKIGYVYSGFDGLNNTNICLTQVDGTYSCIDNRFIKDDNRFISWSYNREDCGTDVKKFLKIAKQKFQENEKLRKKFLKQQEKEKQQKLKSKRYE